MQRALEGVGALFLAQVSAYYDEVAEGDVQRSLGAGIPPSPASFHEVPFPFFLGVLQCHDFHYFKLSSKGEILK